ncbi:unnamed protein product, partial [Nesidiocoris tenuis]
MWPAERAQALASTPNYLASIRPLRCTFSLNWEAGVLMIVLCRRWYPFIKHFARGKSLATHHVGQGRFRRVLPSQAISYKR